MLDAIDQGLAGEGAIALASAGRRRAHGRLGAAHHAHRAVDRRRGRARRRAPRSRRALPRRRRRPAPAGSGARTYVELDGVELGGAPRETALGGIVSRIVAEPTSTGSRVALDLSGPAYRRVFHLLEPFRVVIDIARQPPGIGPTGERPRRRARRRSTPGTAATTPARSGPTGLKEKDVTLAIAHKVAPMLARSGVEITLTRDDDRYVTLEERTARANAFGADLFVSIHCNAAENKTRKGVETYVLDTTANEMAGQGRRARERREPGREQRGRARFSRRCASPTRRRARRASPSSCSAPGIASLGGQYDGVTDGGVHRAGFYVLVGARMPAILLETSYISNAIEEQRLGSSDYQQRLADAIANAIKAYREGR